MIEAVTREKLRLCASVAVEMTSGEISLTLRRGELKMPVVSQPDRGREAAKHNAGSEARAPSSAVCHRKADMHDGIKILPPFVGCLSPEQM